MLRFLGTEPASYGSRFPLFLAALLGSSLGAAFLNLSTATLRRSGGLVSLERILLALTGTTATLLLLHLALSALAFAVHYVTGRLRFIPLLAWSATTVLVVGALSPIWDLIYGSLPLGGWAPAESLMTVSAVWSAALLLPLIAYRLARVWQDHPLAPRILRTLLLVSPLWGAATLLVMWAEVHWVSGILSFQSWLWLGLFLVVTVSAGALAYRLALRIHPLPVQLLALALVMIAPLFDGLQDPAVSTAQDRSEANRPPNVILLSVDTLRADMIPPYPGPDGTSTAESETPALAALAGDSVVFLQARSASPWTKPAMASILTGLSPKVHGAGTLHATLPLEIKTLAEYLQEAGLKTAAIGRNTFLRESFNFDQGFEEYYFFPRGNGGVLGARLLRALLPQRFSTEPSTTELTDFTVHWLQKNQQTPFFLWLHYFDPHGPFAPPRRYLPPEPGPASIGEAFGDTPAIRTGEFVPNLEEREWIRQLYKAEIRHMSDQVGRVIETLKRLGLYESSYIVFTSDHGEEFWEHGGFEHGHTLYDEVLRVPLSIKLPSSKVTRQIPQVVSSEGITPTLLDLLQIETRSERFTSPSLAPWCQDSAPPATSMPIFSSGVHYYEEKESVAFDGYKYIREPLTGKQELFNLLEDPGESRSLLTNDFEESHLESARRLLETHQRLSKTLRRKFKIGDDDPEADLDTDTLQDLRSLGYIN